MANSRSVQAARVAISPLTANRPICRRSRRLYATPPSPAKPSLSAHTASGGIQAPLDYCASLVKRLDPESWLCSYFWPKHERAWWLAWRAFNIELHLVTATVSQPTIAAMRFTFWRDTLDTIFSKEATAVPQHPVAVLLADMRRNRPVQKYYLSQMIDVRAKNLSLPPSAPTFESHLQVHAPLSTSLLLGPLPLLLPASHPSSAHIAHTLSHLSTLLTTVSLLRTLPVLVSSKRSMNIPHDLAGRHGIVEEEVLRKGAEAKGLRDACYEIGTRGMDELITARRDMKESAGRVVPAQVMPLFLSAVPAESYLQRLEKHDFDVFSPELQKHDWRLAPRLWWRAQTRRL